MGRMKSKNKIDEKRMRISFVINLFISVLTVNIVIMTLMGFRFLHGYVPLEELGDVSTFCYFTTQSNVFMGIVSFVFANREYLVLKGKKKSVPRYFYILKMVATVAVSLTFIVVFGYLGFVMDGGHLALLKYNNLFFHLVIPVISIFNFLVFEKTDLIKFKHTFYSLIPVFLYEIYYVGNLVVNFKDGVVTTQSDWYYFLQADIWRPIIVAPMMLLTTWFLSLAIWKINKK